MGKKYVRERPPVDGFDLAGAERWLEETAARGLTLRRWGEWRCKFEVGEPRTVRCRLDPNRIKYWNPEASDEFAELKENYRAMGWEYVCTVGLFYLFESADPDAPELYTDPESKALSLRLLTRKSVQGMLGRLLLCVVALLPFLLGADSGTDFFSRYDPRLYCAPVLYGLLAFEACWAAWFLRRLRDALRRGEMPPKPPRWHRRFERAKEVVIYVLCCVTLIVAAVNRGYEKQHVVIQSNGVVWQSELPHPTLAEMETLDDLEQTGSELCFEPSYFAPAHVMLAEWEASRRTWWDDMIEGYHGAGHYSPNIAVELWELRYPSMTPDFYADLVTQEERWLTVEPLVVDGADEAALAVSNDGARQIVLLYRGDRVAEISYYGAGTLTEHLESVAAMMSADWRICRNIS